MDTVCDGTSTNGKWGSSCEARDEAENHKLANVLAQGAADDEGDKDNVASMIDNQAPVHL
jgi:hypothetical protein